MKNLIVIILLIGLFSCSNNQKESNKINIINQDTSLISKYNNQLSHSSKIEREFIIKLLKTVNSFQGKNLDTTIYSYCYIDNDEIIDTLKTRVYDNHDTIIVYSSWTKNGCKLWEEKIKNPYLWISNKELFQYDKRDKWVTFTIGIYHAIPGIYKVEDYKNLKASSIETGLKDLKENGFNVNKESYTQYVLKFKGNIIVFGEPENREGMFIWYEPLKRFVSFYHE